MGSCVVRFGLLLSLGACAVPAATPSLEQGRTQVTDVRFEAQDSGLEGRMWLGPMCPVVREDEPCPDRPHAGLVRVSTLEGAEVAQIQGDAEGRFRLGLKPGRYSLIGATPRLWPRVENKEIEVPQGGYAQVEVHFDSGIR